MMDKMLSAVVCLTVIAGCTASRTDVEGVAVSVEPHRRTVQSRASHSEGKRAVGTPLREATAAPILAAGQDAASPGATTRDADAFPPTLSFWFSLHWENAKQYGRFAEVLRNAAAGGVRHMTVSISGNDARVRSFVDRLLRDVPGVHLTVSLSTAELMRRVDGPPETWEQMGRLARWCAERTGTGRCVIDFEWSLLPWYKGEPGTTLDLQAFRRNARALAAAAGPIEILAYPANYRAVEWKRVVTMSLLSAEIPRFRQIGTTWHSPHTWRAAPAADIRRIDEALSYRPPVEQIILGATWWQPGTLRTVLADIPPDRELWLWYQMPRGILPTPELITETLAVVRAARFPAR